MPSIERSLRRAAVTVIAASVLGPASVLAVALLRRPAPWTGPEAFLASFQVTLVHLPWVLTPVGLGFYAGWNLLVVGMMVEVLRRFPAAQAPRRSAGAGLVAA
jgi:ABC-type molybdate transport system permease subunit